MDYTSSKTFTSLLTLRFFPWASARAAGCSPGRLNPGWHILTAYEVRLRRFFALFPLHCLHPPLRKRDMNHRAVTRSVGIWGDKPLSANPPPEDKSQAAPAGMGCTTWSMKKISHNQALMWAWLYGKTWPGGSWSGMTCDAGTWVGGSIHRVTKRNEASRERAVWNPASSLGCTEMWFCSTARETSLSRSGYLARERMMCPSL